MKDMWIEQRPITLTPLNIKQKSDHYLIEAGGQILEISALQYQYFDHFSHGSSVHKLVKDYISKGWVVSFREIYNLLEALSLRRWITNPEFQSYFTMAQGVLSSGMKDLTKQKGPVLPSPDLIKKLPFFRNLPKEVMSLFLRNTRVQTVPANTRICISGDTSREMYAMLQGTVGVYRVFPDGKRLLISAVPAGSVFGEGGFLLNKPRSADVISLEPSTIAVIDYSPDLDLIVNSGKAELLQQRFWVLQGLLASEIFSHMPIETLDSLVFAGKIISVKGGTVLTKEGDSGNCFYIVIQGSIAFTQKSQSLRTLAQGGIFGEVALMVSGGKRTATAQAQRDSVLLQIDMPEFYELLSMNLILAKEIETVAWKRWETRIK